MCGIAGIFHRDGRPVDRDTLAAMTRALAHRGPDGEGLWLEGGVGLGHRRLAIRDLSEAGHEPMSDASGRVTISFNGEIYNDRAIRRELEGQFGYAFRSTCDAEVVPLGYLAWGEEIFRRLEGMFAVALWDARDRKLILARDGIGIKPLYFSDTGTTVRFASELKGLVADPGQARAIAPAALHGFLAQGYAAPDGSLLDGVEQVGPGTYCVFDHRGRRDTQYWRPVRRPDITRLEDGVEAFGRLWEEVVDDTLVSDVPVGVLQSGGIDSSLVSMELAGRRRDVPLFTAAFQETSHDEAAAAGSVGRSAGLQHHVVPVSEPASPEARFREIVHHFDGQVADSSAYAFYPLAAAVRRQVTVALSGDGGDEMFGGYPTYRASRLASALSPFVPRGLAAALGRAAFRVAGRSEARLPAAEVVGRFAQGLAVAGSALGAHVQWRRLLSGSLAQRLYGPGLAPCIGTDPLEPYAASAQSEGGLVDRCMSADQRFYLPGDLLMKTDAMSMAHGLEIRVPLLDRRIMDLAGRMDFRLLTPFGGPDKKLLRAALQRYGAPGEITRSGKRGFNVPIAGLLRGALGSLGERYLAGEPGLFEPFLKPDEVRALWSAHQAGTANHAYVLWALLTFALWRETL